MQLRDKLNKKTMIPFALVNNKVKGIDEITRLDTPTCLECGESLILRNGEKNRKHLAHKSDSKCIYRENLNKNNNNQNQETYEHKFAKEYLKDNLTYFREYGHSIIIKDGEFKLAGYRDLKVENIEIEYRGLKKDLNLSRDYIPDILIKTKDKLIALEVYMSNKKDPIVLKDILKNKNISVYEVDIRKIPELNIINIFKNMKLIYSDLKIEFDNAIKSIQNIIIERENLIKTLNNQKSQFELDKMFLESQVTKYRDDFLAVSNQNSQLKKIINEQIENVKYYKTRKTSSEIEYLENKIKELKVKVKEDEKCRKACVKSWYSKKFNENLKELIEFYSTDDKYINIKNTLLMIKFYFNGKVGSYVTYGGDDKLKEIANIIKVFNEEIKYLEEDTEYFKEVIGL